LGPSDTCVSEVATVPELVHAAHFRARDVFVRADAPGHGEFEQVGWVFAGMRRDQPGSTLRDATITDTDALLGEAGFSREEIAAPTMLSVWFRPHHWAPGRTKQALPLQVHFDMKERFGLPEAVMTDNTIVFYEPVRPGDVLRTRQVLRSVSEPKTTKLGTGRFWVIDVEYLNGRDELVGVESYTGFGYKRGDE